MDAGEKAPSPVSAHAPCHLRLRLLPSCRIKFSPFRHAPRPTRRMNSERRSLKKSMEFAMPKLNARENARNRAQAKKRARNRLLRDRLLGPSPSKAGTHASNSAAVAPKK